MRWRPIYLLLWLVCIRGLKLKKTDVDHENAQNTQSSPLYGIEESTHESNNDIFFIEEPQKEYYLIKNKPAIIKCSALNAKFLNVKCVGQWLNPQIVIEKTQNTHKSDEDSLQEAETTSEIDSAAGNSFQNGTHKTDISRVSVKITKNDLKDFVDPQGYWCECYAWEQPPSSLSNHHVIRSSRTIIHNAFMRRYFEREPLSTSVELGGTVQLECLPPPGIPPPEVSWMKGLRMIDARNDANFIISNEGNLIIVQARLVDADNYTCVAHNVAFKLRSDQARVVVYEKEEWSGWSGCSNRCSQSRSKKCTQKVPVQAGMYCVQDWQEWRLCGARGDGGDGGGDSGDGGGDGGNDGDGGHDGGGGEKFGQSDAKKKDASLCPVNLWSGWSAWSSCSIDCIQHKKRYCNNGNNNNKIKYNNENNGNNNHFMINGNNNNDFEKNEKEDNAHANDMADRIINKRNNKNQAYNNNNENNHNNNNIIINNYTNYCFEYELELRNCTVDSCFMLSYLPQRSEATKAMLIIIIIIATVLLIFFIFIISYRLFPNKSSLWDKVKFGKPQCLEAGSDTKNQKVNPTTPLTSNKNDGNLSCTDGDNEGCIDHSNNINYNNFNSHHDGKDLNKGPIENNSLNHHSTTDMNDSSKSVCTNNHASLFGSYKQRIRLRMLRKLIKQKELLQADNETKHLNHKFANNASHNGRSVDNVVSFANNINELNNNFNSANNFNIFNNNNNNINNNSNNSSNNNSNKSNNSSNNNDSLYNRRQHYFSTSPSTSTSTTTSNRIFKKQKTLTKTDIKETACDDVIMWNKVGVDGGEINFENKGVSISVPRDAFTEDHVIFLSVSRVQRPQLKGTQTLLSSVVLCGFEGEEKALHKPALIKLRHNALSINSDQWLFTLFKFNQSDAIETSHLEPTSFSLDEEYCYVTDHVLSGYALIGQPSFSNGGNDDDTQMTENESIRNDNSCSIHFLNINNEHLNKNNPEINEVNSIDGVNSNEKSVVGSNTVVDNENTYDIIMNDSTKNKNYNTLSNNQPKNETYTLMENRNCKRKEDDKLQSEDINESLYTNLSGHICTNKGISKTLKIAAFFPITVTSKEINFKIYFIDDNPDSFEYAVEVERREGYVMLGTPKQFHFQFQRGGDVRVSLTDLNPLWSSLNQQQEIPFGHLWNNHQMNIHCSFSLHHQHDPHLQQQLLQHQFELQQQQQLQQHQQLQQQQPQQQVEQQYYQQLSFLPTNLQETNLLNHNIPSTSPQQSDPNFQGDECNPHFPKTGANPFFPQRLFSLQNDVHTNYFGFSCTILINQKDVSTNFTKYSVARQCFTHNLSDFKHFSSVPIENTPVYNSNGYNFNINGGSINSNPKNYQEINYAYSQGGRHNPSIENIYNSVYDKSSSLSSEPSIHKENVSNDSYSLLKKILSKELDKQGWKQLAGLMGLQKHIGYLESKQCPAELVLNLWQAKIKSHNSEHLNELMEHFNAMQRHDLIDTIKHYVS